MKKLISVILVLSVLMSLLAFPSLAEDKIVLTANVMNLPLVRIVPLINAFVAQHPDVEIIISDFRGANGSEFSTNELQHGKQTDIYFTTKVKISRKQ